MKLGRSVLRLMNLCSLFLESRRAERDSAHIEVSPTLGLIAKWQNESDSDELMDRSTR
jgi:hypothetical protein